MTLRRGRPPRMFEARCERVLAVLRVSHTLEQLKARFEMRGQTVRRVLESLHARRLVEVQYVDGEIRYRRASR